MGVNKRQREMEELKEHYIKKTSCIMFVLMALVLGAFVGNTITVMYMSRQNVQPQSASAPAGQQQVGQHQPNPEAMAKLEQDAANNPTSSEAWVKLGNFYFDHNMPGQAATAYERAVELKPMQVGVWSDLGVMYRRTQRFQKAIEAFKQAANMDPKHTVSRFNMGIVYLHDLNDKENALKAWNEVLAMDPNAKAPNGQPLADLVAGISK